MKRSTSLVVRPGRGDPGRESRWRGLLGRQRRSGLTIRAFCFREGLRETAFHYWRREVARRDGKASRPAGEASRPGSGALGEAFIELRPRGRDGRGDLEGRGDPGGVAGEGQAGVSMELLLAGGRRLLIWDGRGGRDGHYGVLDPALLRQVVEVLEGMPC